MPTPADSEARKRVILGRITGAHGVAGWLKVFSYTEPRDNIFSYQPWLLGGRGDGPEQDDAAWTEVEFIDSGRRGKNLAVKFAGIDDRDEAGRLADCLVAVYREQLPAPAPGEYYRVDLLRMEVMTVEGRRLGKIVDIRETGANDVLVVEGETRCLVPFVRNEVVRQVDLDNGVVEVEWQWD